MRQINWIFFDVGSTLVDETAAYDHRIRDMLTGTHITFQQFDDMRICLARRGLDGNSAAIRYFGLQKTPWHGEDEIPYPDAGATLRCLHALGYHLGIIANQSPGLRQRLAGWDLLSYFEVVIFSAEAGFAKPEPAIFSMALQAAHCKAGDAVMVGDRLDHDIAPAKALGMTTVWVKTGLARFQSPDLGKHIADAQINSLSELPGLLQSDQSRLRYPASNR